MAADGVNIAEDAEMADCEGDKVVTMMDVLQEQQEFEEDANAVLGASDDKNCTYAKGYIKRQAIYACLTCCPDVKTDPTKRAGVCLACSLMCHENHELVELYTKRNFRCDCGNPKFNSHTCQFTPSKPDLNDDNIYNQNFSGLYCICHRPYPDPEATTEDDMIQCIICEDWLHASHLDAIVPANDQYSEMICKGCMEKNDFLHDYSNFAVNIENVDVDILTVNGVKSLCNGSATSENLTNSIAENHSDSVAVIPNGADTEVSADKAKDEAKSVDEKEELIDSSEVTKQTAASDKVESDNINLDAASQKEQENYYDKTAETNDITKTADESGQSENAKTDTAEQKPSTSNDPIPKTQEQKDEHSDQNVSVDKDNTSTEEDKVESTQTKSSVDANKSEDQLLDDIQALTSDNPPNDVPKSSCKETTKSAETDKEKAEDSLENEGSCINTEHNEEPSVDKITHDSSASVDANSVSETNIEVPDTSQLKDSEMATSDDKTDSVMDAIDELLKGPTETDNSVSMDNENKPEVLAANNENGSEPPKTSAIEMSDSGNKSDNIPEKTDSYEKNSTDVEMTETKSQDESSENKTEPTADNSCAKSNLDINFDSKSSVIDKEVNGATINENVVLTETDNKNVDEEDDNSKKEPAETTNEHKRKLSVELTEETTPKKIKLDKCVRPKHVKKVYKGATFWPSNFRQKLCTCGECISMYKDLHVLFLTDPEDTVSAYENLGKENVDCVASQYEKGLQALSSLDRIQQINALTEYNKMRDKLLDFLKSFKDRKEIVKEEDIKAFFAGMKPRREPDGVYFCR